MKWLGMRPVRKWWLMSRRRWWRDGNCESGCGVRGGGQVGVSKWGKVFPVGVSMRRGQ